jgi:hypothetical protein|tara:strand:- start:805 stop:1056 length:252 start_codon:yes stop_codon:yes gene_type:complete
MKHNKTLSAYRLTKAYESTHPWEQREELKECISKLQGNLRNLERQMLLPYDQESNPDGGYEKIVTKTTRVAAYDRKAYEWRKA